MARCSEIHRSNRTDLRRGELAWDIFVDLAQTLIRIVIENETLILMRA